MESRTVSKRFRELAEGVIEQDSQLAYLRESDVTIEYLESDREKTSHGKTVCAECERVPDKYRWAIPYDFTITYFMPNIERMNDDQLRILTLHELLHVGVERDGNEESYRIVPHDIEDFRVILDRYGMDWAL